VDLGADHAQGLSARVDIVQARLDCADVPAELLVDAVVGLRHDFVGVVDEAAAEAGHPGTRAPAALAPAVHAFAVEGHLGVVLVCFGKGDMLGLAGESISLLWHPP